MKLISGMIVIHVIHYVVGILSTSHLALKPRRACHESVYMHNGINNVRPTQPEKVHGVL